MTMTLFYKAGLLCFTAFLSARAQFTLGLSFDPFWDPGLDVLLGTIDAEVGLSGAGLSLGVDLKKRGGNTRCATREGHKLDSGCHKGAECSSGKQKKGVSTVTAQDIMTDNAWTANITVGTPAQTIQVVLDSGSTDAFFFDQSCESCELTNHTAFDAARSKTFENGTSMPFDNVAFIDSTTLAGYTGNDTVRLGSSVAVKSQLLGLVTRRTRDVGTSAYSGIVGLGRSRGSFFNVSASVFGNACLERILDAPLFGVALVKADKDGQGGGGEYNFGKINQDFVSGDIVYAETSSTTAWGLNLTDLTANGQSLFAADDFRRALVDTGATLIKTSDAAATALHALIPGARFIDETQSWAVPCNTSCANGAPNIFFSISGVNFGVPAEDLAFQSSLRGQDAECLSGVQGGSNLFTSLGDIFIKSALSSSYEPRHAREAVDHYVIFDFQSFDIESVTPRIGFANRTDVAPIH